MTCGIFLATLMCPLHTYIAWDSHLYLTASIVWKHAVLKLCHSVIVRQSVPKGADDLQFLHTCGVFFVVEGSHCLDFAHMIHALV